MIWTGWHKELWMKSCLIVSCINLAITCGILWEPGRQKERGNQTAELRTLQLQNTCKGLLKVGLDGTGGSWEISQIHMQAKYRKLLLKVGKFCFCTSPRFDTELVLKPSWIWSDSIIGPLHSGKLFLAKRELTSVCITVTQP